MAHNLSNISFVEDIKSFEQCVYLQVLSDWELQHFLIPVMNRQMSWSFQIASKLMSAGFLLCCSLSLSSTPLQLSRTHYRFPHLTYAPASNPCSCIFLPLLKATALCYSILDCCTIVSVAPVTDPGAHIKSQNVTEPSHIWIFHSAKSQIYTHSQEPFGNKSGKVKLLLKYNVKLCDDIS